MTNQDKVCLILKMLKNAEEYAPTYYDDLYFAAVLDMVGVVVQFETEEQ